MLTGYANRHIGFDMDEFVRVTAASGAGRIHPRAKYRVDAKVIIDLDFSRLILYRLFVLKAQEWS